MAGGCSSSAGAPAEPGFEPLRIHALRRCSLEDFDEFDPSADIESPRSLAACDSEGIRLQDLIFIPPEAFVKPGVSPEVAAARFEYFESYRQDLLLLARKARHAAISGVEQPHSLSPRDDPKAQYRHTFEWFRAKLLELDLKIIPAREDWSSTHRSPEFKRVDNFGAGRTSSPSGIPAFQASSASGPPGLLGKSASVGSLGLGAASPVAAEGGAGGGGGGGSFSGGSTWWSMGGKSWRSATSEDALQSMLHQIRTAPGSDWREMESAKRVEDTFGPLRELSVKARHERHSDQQRLLETRTRGLKSSFKALHFEQQRKDRYRDIREMLSPPARVASKKDGQRRATENIWRAMEEDEAHRQEHYFNRISKEHALEKHVDEERFRTRMKYCQMTMEDRVRWRHNYAAKEEEWANERAGVLENFRRKQAQLDSVGKQAEDTGAMRREVMNLRHTHRTLDEYRRCRKDEYEKAVQALKLKELAEQRIEAAGGCLASLSSSFSKSQAPFHLPAATTSPASAPFSAASPLASPAASPKASTGPILDYSDMDAVEQLSSDELRWMQRVISPKASRGGLSRNSTAPMGLLRAGGGGATKPRP